jgi:hypothetical protein
MESDSPDMEDHNAPNLKGIIPVAALVFIAACVLIVQVATLIKVL